MEDLEELNIIGGKFSDAGNYLGICQEKGAGHAPLHIYKAQLENFGWSKELNNVELPFFAFGRWQEVANKPGSSRFTARIIYKKKEDFEKLQKLQAELDEEIRNIYKNK